MKIDLSLDGKSLVYTLAENEYQNNTRWLQPLDLDKQTPPQRIANLGVETIESCAFAGRKKLRVQGKCVHDVVLLRVLK